MNPDEQMQAVREMFPAVHAEVERLRADNAMVAQEQTITRGLLRDANTLLNQQIKQAAKFEAENAELREMYRNTEAKLAWFEKAWKWLADSKLNADTAVKVYVDNYGPKPSEGTVKVRFKSVGTIPPRTLPDEEGT